MKFTLGIFILSFIIISSCKTETTCADLKNGKFEIQTSKDIPSTLIKRTDSIQIEYDLNTGDSTKYKIEWISPCTYTLEMIEGKLELLEFFEGQKQTVEIKEVYQDSFIVRTSMNETADTNPITIKIIK